MTLDNVVMELQVLQNQMTDNTIIIHDALLFLSIVLMILLFVLIVGVVSNVFQR